MDRVGAELEAFLLPNLTDSHSLPLSVIFTPAQGE
jgi:hypothetical protein